MRLLCREDHDDVPEDRCPPHEFVAAGWDNEEGKWQSAIFCTMCAAIMTLEPTKIPAPSLESIRADAG